MELCHLRKWRDRDPYEECDDGNNIAGDGVSGRCQIEPNYHCDTDAIPCTCTLDMICGNGLLEPGEVCDDGNTQDGDGCNATCDEQETYYICVPGTACFPTTTCDNVLVDSLTVCEAGCGDDIVDEAAGEECDFGATDNSNAYDGCTPGCLYGRRCGDGVAQSEFGEECDYGDGLNTGGYGGCNPNCLRAPYCGVLIIQPDFEQCDDGYDASHTTSNLIGHDCTNQCLQVVTPD